MNGNDFMAWVLAFPAAWHVERRHDAHHHYGTQNREKIYNPCWLLHVKNENLWVITSRERTWWKNLQGGAQGWHCC
jgi:hypothetical protein